MFHANMAARIAGPAAGIPPRRILCEIQTVEIERRWHLWLDGWTVRLCRAEIGNSPSVVEHLARQAHIPRARLRCVWGAVDGERIRRAAPFDRAALGLAQHERLVLWTGRLDPVKGFEEMLGGCGLLKDRHSFRLVLAGEGAYRNEVLRLVRDHSLESRVILLGATHEVPALLRAADLFLFCSRTEGLPNSLLEAMAAGLPIVATDVPGNRDLVRDGQNALVVPARRPDRIAGAMDRLFKDPALAARLGRAAQEWVGRHAAYDRWLARWSAFYASCIHANGWGREPAALP
jgi:glycosyltransferase involved in cell wall biosynthesis